MSPLCRARAFQFLVAIALSLVCGTSARALRDVGGKEKLTNDPGWPDGALEVANLPSRFMYSTGDGTEYEFLYRGTTASFQEAVTAFAAIRAPAVELYLHDGPHVHWIPKAGKDDGTIDWTFTIWNPRDWHEHHNGPHAALYFGEHRPVPPPRIDLYLGDPARGGVDWRAIKVTAGETVRVIDQRAAAQKVKPVAGAMIRGALYDVANGKTISAVARVEAQMLVDKEWETVCQATTDAKGAFTVDKIPAGSYRVLASALGYAPRVLRHAQFEHASFAQFDGELSAEVAVKGRVIDDHGKPIVGARVSVDHVLGIDGRPYAMPERAEVTTDAAGRFALAGMPTGYALFGCAAKGLVQLEPRTPHKLASWNVIEDRGRTVRPTGETPVELRMSPPGAVRVKVTDDAGKAAKGEVYVTIADAAGGYTRRGPWQRQVKVTADGTADVAEVPPGRYYVVTGFRVDYYPDALIVEVTSGTTTEVKISGR
jgi:hypothetical protein